MLSNEDITQLLQNGELVIDPFDDSMIRACGVTLHLGHQLLRPIPGVVVDVKNGTVPEHQTIMLSADEPFQLDPGAFVLGHTLERVTVGPQIGFLIEGRSTLARVGLTIVQTAMMVYPGHHNRTVTLELANHGPNPILLYPEMKIARVALFRLDSPSSIRYDTSGKYRHQELVGPPVFEQEFREGAGALGKGVGKR